MGIGGGNLLGPPLSVRPAQESELRWRLGRYHRARNTGGTEPEQRWRESEGVSAGGECSHRVRPFWGHRSDWEQEEEEDGVLTAAND